MPLQDIPVYHATHHGPQTLLGVIARQLFGSSLVRSARQRQRQRERETERQRGIQSFTSLFLYLAVTVSYRPPSYLTQFLPLQIIWDHGMLWRERIKALSEVSLFSLFVRNGLVCLTRLAAWINY